MFKLDQGVPVYGIDLNERILIFPLNCSCMPTTLGGFLNPYLQSVLLGIVEGLTEFLPVSSTAHLRIAEALMKIPLDDAYWKMYTIVIQLGAIIALALLFLGRIVEFIRTFPGGKRGPHVAQPSDLADADRFAFTSVPACRCTSGATSTWAT